MFAFGLVIAQTLAVLFYGLYFRHIMSWDPVNGAAVNKELFTYPLFQDVHIMIYVGFGFLLTSFHKFRLSSLTMCFWVAALCVQYYFLFNALWLGVFNGNFDIPTFGIYPTKLIAGEVSAGALLIALCAIIGKTNSFQYLIITIWGCFLYTLNEQIVMNPVKGLSCRDVGGSMIIHAFGAFYGIGITWMYNYKDGEGSASKNLHETQDSLSMAMIGTLFLWCFWPSFNGALASTPQEVFMGILNTYFSIIGSVVSAYAASLLAGKGKFTMSHIINATLAGGVVMGSSADIMYEGWVAYLVGSLSGILSVFLFRYAPGLLGKLGIHDVAGVFNLHAIPGLLGGLVSAICRAVYIRDGKGGNQVAGAFISVGIGLGGGLIVGLATKKFHHYSDKNDYFNDLTTVAFEEVVEEELKLYGHAKSNNQQERPNAQIHANHHTQVAPETERRKLE